MAFSYETRQDAVDAGALLEIAEALICRDHDSGLWGWMDGAASSADAGKAHEADPADRVAQPGDVVLQVSGPMLPAMARLEAERLARKLGLTIIIRDAITMTEVGRAVRGAKGAAGGGGGSIVRDERGLTEKQGIILDLVSRLDGATSKELTAGGATDAKSVNWEYQMNCITRATKGLWVMAEPKARMELNAKGRYVATTAYRMEEMDEAFRAAALYDVECHMVARKQLDKVHAPKPAEVANDDGAHKLAAD
jgi:hypothetical protein